MVEGKRLHTIEKSIKLICLLIVTSTPLFSQTDTAGKKIKIPKHYFATTIFADWYTTPQRNIVVTDPTDPNYAVAKRLKDYQYSQSVGGFYFPISTTEKVRADQTVSNFHFLGTGSYLLAMPRFSGISNHDLVKVSLGLRGIYNSGRKGIWFFDASPFLSSDLSASGTTAVRWASTVLYDRMVSPSFSYRVGFTRTFILGNRLHLPYLGIRIGKLNRTYFSAQFPRGVTLSMPIRSKMRFSIFLRPSGNLLTMGNTDSLYNGINKKGQIDKTIIFGRYDGLAGFRFDYNHNKYLSLFCEFGNSKLRGIALYSREYNKPNGAPLKDDVVKFAPFFGNLLASAGFIDFGLTVRFGKTKSVYNNYNMYEVFNTNSTISIGDNTNNTGDGNIPNQVKKKAISEINTKDVQDLIEAQDLY